jgi:hypothetical protein
MFLQLQPNFIQGLQEFHGGFKEEFAHFRRALVREEVHEATSSRW